MSGIVKVHIENFKKIKDLTIDLNCKSIMLLGDNEVGKTSFLQAVFKLLGNEPFTEQSITEGEEKGQIRVHFIGANDKKYIATRKFTQKNPKGYFEIEAEDDGLKTSKLDFLEKVVGNISFNPFEFAELAKTSEGRKKQVKLIRQLIPAQVNEAIDELNNEYEEKYKERTELGREIKLLEGRVAHVWTREYIEKYKDAVDVTELNKELTLLNENNNKIIHVDQKIAGVEQSIKEKNEALEKVRRQLEEAESLLNQQTAALNELRAAREKMEVKDTIEITQKINTSSEHNLKVKEIADYMVEKQELEKKNNKHEQLDAIIKEKAEKRIKLISDAGLPIPGLSFNEEGVFLNGMLLDEDQVSTSQIMEVGVRISVAINPKLKILRIPKGESLGVKRMQDIKDFADKHGYQIFMEKVEPGNDNLTIRFFED